MRYSPWLLLALLVTGLVAGCSNTEPTGEEQMDKYNENLKGAKELGGEKPADVQGEQ